MINDPYGRVWGTSTVASILLVGALTWAMPALAQDTPVDYTGDGVSDFAVARPGGGFLTWWVSNALTSMTFNTIWGLDTDQVVSGDFDGDGTSDIAIWRAGLGGAAGFWIRPSSTGVAYFERFGVTGDDPTILGDYDGDGKTDVAVFRRGAVAGDSSYWFYRRSIDGVTVVTAWGGYPDYPAPGDYDGDGRNDFAIQRDAGGGNSVFCINQTTDGITCTYFGVPTDFVVPGDYDGDGKTDIALARNSGGVRVWWIKKKLGRGRQRSLVGTLERSNNSSRLRWRRSDRHCDLAARQ